MKVIIFGATGSVGRLTVKRALQDGHDVTAFARHPETLETRDPRLTLVSGDAQHGDRVSEAVSGHDAVIIVLGAGAHRSSRIRSQGTQNVIRAMQTHDVRRLICQSTLGAHESRPNLNFLWKWIMFGILLRPVLKDHEVQEDLVRGSGLDWTIVRPSAFTDDHATGRYREGFGADERGLSLKIARADVAGFLTRLLGEQKYLHKAVAIST